ncbi:hypothetical protein AMS68_006168 [Peltaster fructicola]|uniref:PDZ GRASP-type domain-containing protein n=1 Tax=Peltaster fructicola TaxID=286661 RepID=A0A6H0Y151_9PEZI|nr:hypothetical protein AMS68_006168 [Peltaster fructicola]
MANMFGAINRFISRLDSDGIVTQQSKTTGYGFQVLRATNIDLPLEPWFDFIIGINGRTIDNPEPSLLATEIRNCAGTAISLGVYSAKGQHIREVYATVPQDGSSLGLSLQWTPLSLAADVWHILDVMPNSPADVAGLLPYSDYVVGSPETVLRGEGGLGELIEQYMNRALRLWVYNSEYDVTRMITITPAKNWGGDGALGCVLGYGALHRVPAPLTEPTHAPGETLFDGEKTETRPTVDDVPESTPADFLIPADMPLASPASPAPPSGKARKARAHHNTAPAAGLDDYFKEGEEQSREADNAPSAKAAGAPPPPPKASK